MEEWAVGVVIIGAGTRGGAYVSSARPVGMVASVLRVPRLRVVKVLAVIENFVDLSATTPC